jgi:hypothetical protein
MNKNVIVYYSINTIAWAIGKAHFALKFLFPPPRSVHIYEWACALPPIKSLDLVVPHPTLDTYCLHSLHLSDAVDDGTGYGSQHLDEWRSLSVASRSHCSQKT